MIEINNLQQQLKEKVILDKINLELETTGITALVAPNGAGKTTLLSIIAGIMEPTAGSIRFSDGDFRDVTLLLAGDKNLYMKNTVAENVLYFAALNGKSRKQALNSINTVSEWFPELSDLWHSTVEVLSYGQKRLVAVATAVIANKKYLLIDEAIEGLDVEHVARLTDALRMLSRTQSIVVSSHDLKFSATVADHILFLANGHVITEPRLSETELRKRYATHFSGDNNE